MANTRRLARLTMLTTLLALTVACGDSRDARLAELAKRSLDEQARQNERLAEQSRQIAEASRQLVQADAESRKRLAESQAALQQEIESARENVDRQRDELERERREISRHRYRDPLLAQAIGAIGLTLACLLPLGLAGYVLYSVNRPTAESADLGELLVTEIASPEPLLLPPPRGTQRLEHRPQGDESGLSEPEPDV